MSLFHSSENERSRSSFFWPIVGLSTLVFIGVVAALIILMRPQETTDIPLEGVLREGNGQYGWYEKYIQLKKPEIQMGQNFAGKRMVIFSGIIENGGERALDVVEVELKFFNYDKLVWRTRRIPIKPGRYTPPIEPLQQRGFTLYMENIPEDWLASHAEMAVSGFRFAPGPSERPL